MTPKEFTRGPTGRYPRGKADEHDEGELVITLAADHQNAIVRLEFGTPIAWLGLPAQEARELARLLNKHADDLDRTKP
jgi:hypothetical protein